MAIELVDKRNKRNPNAKVPEDLPAPTTGAKVYYEGHGFGVRVTSKGARSFVLNYRTRSGIERRYTIGALGDWTVTAARERASEIRRRIREEGYDPLEEIETERSAPTVARLAEVYRDVHLPTKRPKPRRDDESMLKRDILPKLAKRHVAEVDDGDIASLHRQISKRAPYRANRVHSLLHKMFALAEKSHVLEHGTKVPAMRPRGTNPCDGIQRNPEEPREVFLTPAEIVRLADALNGRPKHEQQSANVVRLLLLTGARRGEVLGARWDQFDLEAGVWTKPSAHTKQKKVHRLPLSAPAQQLLAELKAKAGDSPYVFPSKDDPTKPQGDLKNFWRSVCEDADLMVVVGHQHKKDGTEVPILKPKARIHDLRHTHASVLASANQSLPIIGRLLGHTQASTTARYAHLYDDPLREATERVGAVVTNGGKSADVVDLPRSKSA